MAATVNMPPQKVLDRHFLAMIQASPAQDLPVQRHAGREGTSIGIPPRSVLLGAVLLSTLHCIQGDRVRNA